jgi:dTDP-4-amino-4,6-dideoxygalactose transaminase
VIPFNRATAIGGERERVCEALADGPICGDGRFGRMAEKELEGALGVQKALLVTSCTHALEMSALLLDFGPGDEVILPSFTFVSTANAFVLRGARPVFVDVRPDTMNLDESRLEAAITKRTKAVVPVHYAGVGCEMDAIGAIARRHGIAIVEDNAHGLFATYRGRQLGTFGSLATQSFHETKNFTCGEGGALLVNDERLVERAEILREKGTNRSRFFRGQVDKYTWVDVGSSYVVSDLLAAMLSRQLEARAEVQRLRARIWNRYRDALADWGARTDVRLPVVPEHCEQGYHMFYLVLPSLERRTAFIDHMAARGAKAVFHYQPLHLSPMGRSFGGEPGSCPVTERLGDCLVRLPFYTNMSEDEQTTVIAAAVAFA